MSNLGGIIDVAIGMSFVYLLLSLVCSGLNELLAWALSLRSNTLREGIGTLLGDPALRGLAGKVYRHPLISGLPSHGASGKKSEPGPSYIPSGTFVLALLDVLREPEGKGPRAPRSLLDSREGIEKLLATLPAEDGVRRQLELLLDDSVKTASDYRRRVETWFNQSMDRLSGSYKRTAQRNGLVVAMAVSFLVGVDSWTVANSLMHDTALRQAVVTAAVDATRSGSMASNPPTAQQATKQMTEAIDSVNALGLPVGVSYLIRAAEDVPADGRATYWLFRILGMVFTGLALALGAPFWFDMLGKLTNVRASGPAPEKKAAPAST